MHDPPGRSGLTHLLEHLLFRGNELVSEREIDECFELSGGDANGYTYHDALILYFEVYVDGFRTALRTLARMVSGERIREDLFEKEKRLAVSEARESLENPQELVVKLAVESLYSGTPLGRPIEGWPEEVMSISLNEVLEFKHRYLTCDNMVAVLYGAVSKSLVEEAVRELSRLPCCGEKPLTPSIESRSSFKRSSLKGISTCYAAIAWSLPGLYERPTIPFELGVLGFNMGVGATSILFRKLRLERNLAYDYHVEYDYHKPTSYLVAAAYSVDCSHVDDALEVLSEAPQCTEEAMSDKRYVEGRRRYYAYITSPSRVDESTKAVITLLRILRGREPLSYEDARRLVLGYDWSSVKPSELLKASSKIVVEPG